MPQLLLWLTYDILAFYQNLVLVGLSTVHNYNTAVPSGTIKFSTAVFSYPQ